MVEQTEALCDLWEGISAVLPLHSRLYHLEPIGVGKSHGGEFDWLCEALWQQPIVSQCER